MALNFGDVFKFPFKDKKWWVKILIGIVPIANLGYLLRVLADAKDGKEATLPEWEGWEDLFKNGIIALVICLVFAVPIIVLNLLGAAPVIGLLFKLLAIIAGVFYGPIVSIGLCRYLESNQLKEALNWQGLLDKFKVNIKDYLLVAVIFTVVFGVLGVIAFASIFTLCLFPLVFLCIFYVGFYLKLILIRLYGEIYRGETTQA